MMAPQRSLCRRSEAKVHHTGIITRGTVVMRLVRHRLAAADTSTLGRSLAECTAAPKPCPHHPHCLQRSALAAWAVLALVCCAAAAAPPPVPASASAAAVLEAGAEAEAGELPSVAEQQYRRALEIRWLGVAGGGCTDTFGSSSGPYTACPCSPPRCWLLPPPPEADLGLRSPPHHQHHHHTDTNTSTSSAAAGTFRTPPTES